VDLTRRSACQLAQELLFVHPVLEDFSAVNENHRNFVVERPTEFGVRVDVDFAPSETAPTRELAEALLDDFAKMTTFAGVNHDLAKV